MADAAYKTADVKAAHLQSVCSALFRTPPTLTAALGAVSTTDKHAVWKPPNSLGVRLI